MTATKVFRFASCLGNIEKAVEQILDEVRTLPWEPMDLDFIKLALIEALVNSVVHGNKENPDKWVTVCYGVVDGRFLVEATDEGTGFNPDVRKDYDLLSETGRGLLLIRAAMDEVTFNQKGNSIRLVKFVPRADNPSLGVNCLEGDEAFPLRKEEQ
ncbi:ATP-binding protein [Heliobacterium chlorum]|uniref:ATP-binding protein n=1 Tax=Heliobacterium chlorum TaxID=2698 RepID=A0ABR7SYZ4_HELCL|nr:ATP-binding protein [Heliobacterium chlorum]MBC9783646.1 ATP-binding protein [Heliobacterium chlorum]